jgi:cytochrome d ubiquinol oxidase subunit II
MARPLLLALLAFIVIVSIWTPLQLSRIAERWFSVPNVFFLAQVPVATAIFSWLCWYGIRNGRTLLPAWWCPTFRIWCPP